jgi:hypothetical protein
MTTEQAKEILAAFRPGMDDEQDPIFAEAVQMTRTDAELREWWNESLAFDRRMKTELARVLAPAQVREAILSEHKIIRPAPWWHRRLTGRQWAAAAAVFIAGAVAAVWFGNRPVSFSEFRREIADESWGASPHLEVKVSNMEALRQSLEKRELPSKFTVPSTLTGSGVRGYSLMRWHGHEVPVICFGSEGPHLHLVVVDRSLFKDAPASIPETDQWQTWRTASWSHDDFSYVLTGLNTANFVKKFRKSKRWDWEG